MDWTRTPQSPIISGNWNREEGSIATDVPHHAQTTDTGHTAHVAESQAPHETGRERNKSVGKSGKHLFNHLGELLGHHLHRRTSIEEDNRTTEEHVEHASSPLIASASAKHDVSTPSLLSSTKNSLGFSQRIHLEQEIEELNFEKEELLKRLKEIEIRQIELNHELTTLPLFASVTTKFGTSDIEAINAMTAISRGESGEKQTHQERKINGFKQADIEELVDIIGSRGDGVDRNNIDNININNNHYTHPRGIIRAMSYRDLKKPPSTVSDEQLLTLIENHGEASHTALLEPEYTRYYNGAGVIGYISSDKYAIVMSDPICRDQDLVSL